MVERISFIRAWEAGVFTMTELCEHFGVSRRTGYKWVHRYREAGEEGLGDRSRAPHGCPHRTPDELQAEIIRVRKKYSSWGPKKVLGYLRRTQPHEPWPARSTAGAILDRAGLVKKRKRRRRWQHPAQSTRGATRPNELMTVDFKGEFRLGDRSLCYPLTVQDRYSRYVVLCKGLLSTHMEPVRQAMEDMFRDVGLPERIRSDNGVPFASQGIGGLTQLNVWWMRLGIQHERIAKGRPDQNGAHERMHRDLKDETARPPAQTLVGQQQRFDGFVRRYNEIRSHEGIEERLPSQLWVASPRVFPQRIAEPEYPGHWEIRRVRAGGEFKLHGRMQFLSQALAGQRIGLEPVDDGVWSIVFVNTLLGRYDEKKRCVYG